VYTLRNVGEYPRDPMSVARDSFPHRPHLPPGLTEYPLGER